jgi:hypothetical protein
MNVGIGTETGQFVFLGIHKLYFRYSVTVATESISCGHTGIDIAGGLEAC